MPENGLRRAIAAVGSGTKLARLVGVSPQAVWQWGAIPVRHVLAIERQTGIPREVLRPDIYPPRSTSIDRSDGGLP